MQLVVAPPSGAIVRPHPRVSVSSSLEEPRSGVSKDEWHQRGLVVRDGATRLLTMRVEQSLRVAAIQLTSNLIGSFFGPLTK